VSAKICKILSALYQPPYQRLISVGQITTLEGGNLPHKRSFNPLESGTIHRNIIFNPTIIVNFIIKITPHKSSPDFVDNQHLLAMQASSG